VANLHFSFQTCSFLVKVSIMTGAEFVNTPIE